MHDQQVESLYVVEGDVVLTLGDQELRAPAGSWAQIPPGVPHALGFPARGSRHLSVFSPRAVPSR